MINLFHKKQLIKTYFWAIISAGLMLPVLTNATNGTVSTPASGGPEGFVGPVQPSNVPAGSGGMLTNPLGQTTSITQLVTNIANVMFKIGIPVAAVFIIYGGLKLVMARGNEEQLKSGKNMLKWALIGTAVLLGAEVIARAITATIKTLG